MDNRINERSGLQEIIDKALRSMTEDAGGELGLADVNLAEFQRRTGLSRSKARTLKKNGFKVTPHGRTGRKAPVTVMTGYEATVDACSRRASPTRRSASSASAGKATPAGQAR